MADFGQSQTLRVRWQLCPECKNCLSFSAMGRNETVVCPTVFMEFASQFSAANPKAGVQQREGRMLVSQTESCKVDRSPGWAQMRKTSATRGGFWRGTKQVPEAHRLPKRRDDRADSTAATVTLPAAFFFIHLHYC